MSGDFPPTPEFPVDPLGSIERAYADGYAAAQGKIESKPASDTMLRLEQAMEKYAPAGYDPASDDMTIPFAMELVEKDQVIEDVRCRLGEAECRIETDAKVIAALREALRPFATMAVTAIRDKRDAEYGMSLLVQLKFLDAAAAAYEQTVGESK